MKIEKSRNSVTWTKRKQKSGGFNNRKKTPKKKGIASKSKLFRFIFFFFLSFKKPSKQNKKKKKVDGSGQFDVMGSRKGSSGPAECSGGGVGAATRRRSVFNR